MLMGMEIRDNILLTLPLIIDSNDTYEIWNLEKMQLQQSGKYNLQIPTLDEATGIDVLHIHLESPAD